MASRKIWELPPVQHFIRFSFLEASHFTHEMATQRSLRVAELYELEIHSINAPLDDEGAWNLQSDSFWKRRALN